MKKQGFGKNVKGFTKIAHELITKKGYGEQYKARELSINAKVSFKGLNINI